MRNKYTSPFENTVIVREIFKSNAKRNCEFCKINKQEFKTMQLFVE